VPAASGLSHTGQLGDRQRGVLVVGARPLVAWISRSSLRQRRIALAQRPTTTTTSAISTSKDLDHQFDQCTRKALIINIRVDAARDVGRDDGQREIFYPNPLNLLVCGRTLPPPLISVNSLFITNNILNACLITTFLPSNSFEMCVAFRRRPWMRKILRTAYQKLDWSND
jgi:hypothetical protein